MIQKIRNIYEHIGDEESREIFANRLMFSLTNDREYMTRIIKSTELYQAIYKLAVLDQREKYIVGAGQWGKIIADLLREFNFAGILDNSATGVYRDLPILPMQEVLQEKKEISLYIASTTFHDELCRLLGAYGVEPERIVDVTGMMLKVYHEEQYFDLPCLEQLREKHEVFVDGGCYDGANSVRFTKWAKDAEKTIYAFEADAKNIEKCKETLKEIEKKAVCHFIDKGMWSGETMLHFLAKANEASSIVEEGDGSCIAATSLDSVVKDRVTFIKMDIEGAEYEALRGAQNTITQYHPKCAVSVYHKAEDIWELPQLLLSFYEGYTFYLRHYSLSSEETVLYAVPKNHF